MFTRSIFNTLALLTLTTTVMSAAAAQDAPVPEWQTQLQQKLQRPVTLQLTDAPFVDAVAQLRQLSGISIVLQPKLKAGPVTFQCNNLFVWGALAKIVHRAGLEYALVDDAVYIFEKGAYTEPEAPAAQPLSAEAEKSLEEALPQLRADDFATREKAYASLVALGAGAAARLQSALKSEIDSEARVRIGRILAAFAQPPADFPPEVEAVLNNLNRRVTFELVETPMQDAINFIVMLSKSAACTCDANVMNVPITLRVSDMPVGMALRWMARLSNTQVTVHGKGVNFEVKPAKP